MAVPPEKWGAAILLASWFVSPLVDSHQGFRFGVFITDTVIFFAFATLSAWSRRLWTFVAAGCQLVAVATHVSALLAPHVGSWSYVTDISFWGGYAPLTALAFGIATAKKKSKS